MSDRPDPPAPTCPFTVFHAAKGGTGQSTAAFNVAGLLAGRGYRVLLIDFDLESPGITLLAEGAAARPGLVELLLRAGDEGPSADLHRRDAAAALANYAAPHPLPAAVRRDPDGSLHVLGAGLQGEYYGLGLDRLAMILGDPEGPGLETIEALRALILRAARFDQVVIDGGRGRSWAATCARHLADQWVLLSGLGRQHVDATARWLAESQALLAPSTPTQVIFSPVPAGEDDLVEARLQAARGAFAAAGGEGLAMDLQLPHHPQQAIDEGLQLLRGRGALFEAYRRIEARVLEMADERPDVLLDEAIDALGEAGAEEVLARLRRARLASDGGRGWIDGFVGRFAEAWAAAKITEGRPIFDQVLAHASASGLRQVARVLTREGLQRWDRGALAEAEACFTAALEAGPRIGAVLANSANFLCDVRRELDGAEALYRRAIEVEPENPLFLCNYATFLCDERRDLDGSAAMYERALEHDPEHALSLCNYATFLLDERGDAAAAEAMYERAHAADPEDADAVANLARLHFVAGRVDEGRGALARALALCDPDAPDEAAAECWMYAYCCDAAERREEALARLRALVDDHEVRTGAWSFSGILRQAEAMGHPEARWLPALAEVLAGRQPATTLAGWAAWDAAAAAVW